MTEVKTWKFQFRDDEALCICAALKYVIERHDSRINRTPKLEPIDHFAHVQSREQLQLILTNIEAIIG